jgi:RNA-directed DNA polymerase
MNGDLQHVARIAEGLLQGPWTAPSLTDRLQAIFKTRPKQLWTHRAAIALLSRFPSPPHRSFEIAQWLKSHPMLAARLQHVDILSLPRPVMRPHAAASTWPVPTLCTTGDVAVWLDLTPQQVDGLAGWPVPEHRRHERARNYRYRWLTKSNGRRRLIESPKSRLKAVQRRLLAGVLDLIPPHPAAHAFVCGRSIQSFLAPHVGRNWVLRLDLADFFATIAAARVIEVFRFLGYPESPAQLLTRLCVSAPPRTVLDEALGPNAGSHDQHLRTRLASPHLPQGAPTSPALANLCLFRFDQRLAGLATSRGVEYTRYCDDLVLSGDRNTRREVVDLRRTLLMILADEGLSVCQAKTRFMPAGRRQNVCGLNLNQRLNTTRAAFDQLKAVLHRCATLGIPCSDDSEIKLLQQRLCGQIAYVNSVNPNRGAKLHDLFSAIQWGSPRPRRVSAP